MKNCKLVLKLSVLTSILLLAGCGQKGALFLETDSVEPNPASTASAALNPDGAVVAITGA